MEKIVTILLDSLSVVFNQDGFSQKKNGELQNFKYHSAL